MKANYGYTDGSGSYYVTNDTDLCEGCPHCVEACPENALVVEEDDYGDLVCMVVEEHRRKVKYTCGPCKPVDGDAEEPCHAACPKDAILHSW